jgi:thiamine biosynthesis lipoprotein
LKMFTETERPQAERRLVLNGETMGTRYSVICFADNSLAETVIAAELHQAVTAVDDQMSTWKPGSDLSMLNAAPLHEWVPVPKTLMTVLVAGVAMEKRTSRAFDMNIGALVARSGFGALAGFEQDLNSRTPPVPASKALDIREDLNLVRKRAPVSLDLSGIAKGFGVDELARCLDRFAVRSYLIGIDGEMRAKGRKPNGETWAVALEAPVEGVRSVRGVVALDDLAIATSGDYRHFRDIGGTRMSHTMNPKSQTPLNNAVASVTVLSMTCMEADAMATALMVMGEEAGPAFAKANGIHALFQVRHSAGIRDIPVGPIFATGA